MISSSSQLSGCGVLSVRSMGLPHSGQIGIGPSVAMCLALHLRRAAPFWYRPEPALLLMFPSCVFGGLGEILIRGPVVVFAGRRAVSAWPASPLRYASRGMRGWLRSDDLRFWRPPLYQLSYAHRRSCRLIAMAHDHWVDMSKAPEPVDSEASTLILIRSIPRGGGSLLPLGFCVSRVRCVGCRVNVESWTRRRPQFRGC